MQFPIGPRVSRISSVLMVLLGGCAGAMFTEADREQTKTVGSGSTFRIALPSTHAWVSPALKGAGVLFPHQDSKESSGTTIFQFQAEKEGESEIVIRTRPALGEDLDFSMRVRVLEPIDAKESALDDDWRESWSRTLERDD